MRAADLTDEWIGRTVAVHTPQRLVGRLTEILFRTIKTLDEAEKVTAVHVSVERRGERVWAVVPPETVVTDQEIPF